MPAETLGDDFCSTPVKTENVDKSASDGQTENTESVIGFVAGMTGLDVLC